MFALSSARYQVKTENHKGITLRVYYQAGHEQNVKTMFRAIKDALDYGSDNFSPYPLKQFALAEIHNTKEQQQLTWAWFSMQKGSIT